MIHICINMSLINFLLNLLATFTCGLYVIRLATYTAGYSLILYPYLLNVTVSSRNRSALKVGFTFCILFSTAIRCPIRVRGGTTATFWEYSPERRGNA